MALETGNYIGDLVITNPTSSDLKSQGDDHLRLLKTALKTCFAGFSGAVLLGGADTGGVNNYALTPTPALPAYVSGMMVLLKPSATNTTTSTLNISSLGAKAIKTVEGAALSSGDIVANALYLLAYDGTDFRIVTGPTKNYIDQLSFSSSLPSQTGNGGYYMTTDGTNASWDNLKASPTFTGTPAAPTAAVDTNTTQLATTAFVIGQAYAKLASPALTGTPTAPTGAADITTSQIINAAWYAGQAGTASPAMDGLASSGTSKKWTPIDHVHPTDTSRAPLASPTLTGVPAAPTAAADTNTTQLATTAFVIGQASDSTPQPVLSSSEGPGTSKKYSRADHVHSLVAASQSQMEAASSNLVPATPGNAQYHPSACKAWVKCNAAGTIQASYNITSITDTGTGIVTVTIATDFSSADYCIVATAYGNADQHFAYVSSQAAGSFQLTCSNDGGTIEDPTHYYAACFGDQA